MNKKTRHLIAVFVSTAVGCGGSLTLPAGHGDANVDAASAAPASVVDLADVVSDSSTNDGSYDSGTDGGTSSACTPGSSSWPACADAKSCAYYVAASGGNDSNSGSASAPFASLEKLRATLASAANKVGCLKAGTYDRTSTLTLTAADDHETWQFDPAGNVDTAILDGAMKTDLIVINGGSNITINGLTLRNFNAYGINGSGTGNTVVNCDVGFNAVTSWQSAAITFGGTAPSTSILHNYVHDTGSQAIALFDGYSTPGNIDGSIIQGNVVLRAVQRMYDGGGIYVSMHGGCFTEQTCAVTVKSNFVRDQGSSAISGPYGDSINGIYLDDNASYVTVVGNIVGPPTQGVITASNENNCTAVEIHNGSHNTITGNVLDLGASGFVATANWGLDSASIAGMSNNTFSNNVVLSGFSGNQRTSSSGVTGYSYFNPSPASSTSIHDNLYFNYAGGQARTDGDNTSDSNPTVKDPNVSGWTYTLAAASPALSAPVSVPPLVGGWGPPGFVIPTTGTPPSSPH